MFVGGERERERERGNASFLQTPIQGNLEFDSEKFKNPLVERMHSSLGKTLKFTGYEQEQ